MKKLIKISALSVLLAGTSAFAQGYLIWQSPKSTVYDGFTQAGVSQLNTAVGVEDVALFWAASGNTPAVAALAASSSITGNSTTVASYSAATAWSDILTDPNFHLAATTVPGSAIAATGSKGQVSFNGGGGFGITGTSAGNVALYLVAWNPAAGATPTLAAGAGSAVGWSQVTTFALVGSPTATDIASPAGTFGSFGVFAPISTPEPGSLALAALGGASLLMLRRKK
jgi:hypothetical protein